MFNKILSALALGVSILVLILSRFDKRRARLDGSLMQQARQHREDKKASNKAAQARLDHMSDINYTDPKISRYKRD